MVYLRGSQLQAALLLLFKAAIESVVQKITVIL